MLDDRNLTVHTYNDHLANEIFKKLPQYYFLLQLLITRIEVKILTRK